MAKGTNSSDSAAAEAPQAFAALRHPGFRIYFITSAMAMMGDSTEHVISYWIMYQKFQSPELGGFAVISHWLPFLLFSVWSGGLADRFDPRRIVQLGMLLFIGVSLAWGILFITDTIELWHAAVLLVIHGFAGVFWSPATQLLVHDIVGPKELHSAVRLTATARYLGLLAGPAVGGGLMLLLSPPIGLLVNVLLYLPLTLWLWKAPYGPKFRKGKPAPQRAVRGFADITATMRDIAGNKVIVPMLLLSGFASLFVSGGYHAQMPGFAEDLGHGDADLSYSMLLAADAAGALIAGLVLESRGLLTARVRTAFVLAMIWCCVMAGFAASPFYALSLVLLFAAGFFELSYSSMAQTLVQVQAPAHIRGRVIGLFGMASAGLKTFSGVTIGILGGLIGIHWSLALSAIVLLAIILALWGLSMRAGPPRGPGG